MLFLLGIGLFLTAHVLLHCPLHRHDPARRSSLPDRRQSYFVPQGLNLASGATPETFRRQFGPVDAAHGYHDLNFIAKEVRGIPELKEKEKVTGWPNKQGRG